MSKAQQNKVQKQWKYSIEWKLCTPPPNDKKCLGSAIVDAGQPCPIELTSLVIPGKGYFICVDVYFNHVIKRWPIERKASVRKKRLLSRLDKKYPLFKEEFYQKELESRVDYFRGV